MTTRDGKDSYSSDHASLKYTAPPTPPRASPNRVPSNSQFVFRQNQGLFSLFPFLNDQEGEFEFLPFLTQCTCVAGLVILSVLAIAVLVKMVMIATDSTSTITHLKHKARGLHIKKPGIGKNHSSKTHHNNKITNHNQNKTTTTRHYSTEEPYSDVDTYNTSADDFEALQF